MFSELGDIAIMWNEAFVSADQQTFSKFAYKANAGDHSGWSVGCGLQRHRGR
ncbi:hypothetical protein [Streptomyces goshikiensis]|uniref:hypothetical protein n=1 Tax=Streptomyces goshikiensis TaxID=1942 RepID=UPI00371E0884